MMLHTVLLPEWVELVYVIPALSSDVTQFVLFIYKKTLYGPDWLFTDIQDTDGLVKDFTQSLPNRYQRNHHTQ